MREKVKTPAFYVASATCLLGGVDAHRSCRSVVVEFISRVPNVVGRTNRATLESLSNRGSSGMLAPTYQIVVQSVHVYTLFSVSSRT